MVDAAPPFPASMPPTSGWGGYFLGSWRVSKRVLDERLGRTAEMAGHCVFEPAQAVELRQCETVQTMLDGQSYPAVQTYFWRFDSKSSVVLWFSDRRFFCAADLGAPPSDAPIRPAQAALRHDCPPDSYKGVLAVDGDDRWRLQWRVTGPRKNYHLDAVYQRALAESVPVI